VVLTQTTGQTNQVQTKEGAYLVSFNSDEPRNLMRFPDNAKNLQSSISSFLSDCGVAESVGPKRNTEKNDTSHGPQKNSEMNDTSVIVLRRISRMLVKVWLLSHVINAKLLQHLYRYCHI
jgi:deferrochelatase/peroxidase EfeB